MTKGRLEEGLRSFKRIRIALDRPRLWRLTTAVAALLLCALLVVTAQGSVDVVGHRAQAPAGPVTSWERWCTRGDVREDRIRIAFCARINGIVVYSNRGPAPGEAHVAVVGAFHLTVVKLPTGAGIPAVGTRVVAIGPLFRARNGQREVQAFRLQRS
ncbi:MAG TPA: hypothetical protein VE571_14540 [Solirubrobacteraceae bacterium]|nr:hypothetical protein [Solirubrobacteraceae bacterium]